jgi:MYXO-CTERM domain-containing protein
MLRGIRVSLIVLGCVVFPTVTSAATVELAWDPNSETDLGGYKIYYGTEAQPPYKGTFAKEGASPITIPLSSLKDKQNPTFTLTGIPACQRVNFAVTAYNAGGESDFSNLVSQVIVPKPTEVKVSSKPAATLTLTVSWAALPGEDATGIAKLELYYGAHKPGAYDSGWPVPTTYDGTEATQGPSPIALAATATSQDLTGLKAGQTYFFAVGAACADGTKHLSDAVTAAAVVGGDGGASSGDGGSGKRPSEGCSCQHAPAPAAGGLLALAGLLGAAAVARRARRRGRSQ